MGIVVTLLGTPRVLKDGQEIVFPYRKVEGLFYYLCIKRSTSRDEAIGIFWADCSETSGRKNLRDTIYHLKKLLGEDIIVAEGNNRISLNRSRITSIDYEELTDENLFDCYTDDFLGYFYIKRCMEFEDWATQLREDLLRRYQTAVRERINQAVCENKSASMLECATVLLRKRILEEALYRKILDGLICCGSIAEAEQLYQKLKQLLWEELEMEPEEETAQLMETAAMAGRSGRMASPSGTETGDYFFGREQELMTLLSHLRNFENGGQAKSLLLTGEAGVGKSAILRRLQELLPPERYLVISYQCVQTEEELYLKPWNDILVQVEGFCRANHILSEIVPDFYTKQLDTPLLTTQFELYMETTLQMLVDGRQKIVLLLDDIQWMDKASKRLLSSLIFWSNNKKVLMVLSSREDCADRMITLKAPLTAKGLLEEIVIPRFTLEETQQIVSEYNKINLSEKQVEELYLNTGGNALFLLEILKELAHGGQIGDIPSKTMGIIQSRLVDLLPEDRELLNSISLYPRFGTLEELQVLSGQTKIQLLNSLERLLSRQLICQVSTYNKRGYGFSHQLIRDYIYHSMLEDKRHALHNLVAEYYDQIYEATGDISLCPMLIYHFSRCEDTFKTYAYHLEYLRVFYTVQHEIYPTVLTGANQMDSQFPPLGSEDGLVILAEQIRALKQHSAENDYLRMKMEFLIGRYDLFSGNFEKGLKNVQTSISLAKKLENSEYLMNNYLQLVFHAIQIRDLDMLNEYITACEALLERHQYPETDVYTVRRLRGVYYMKLSQFDLSEQIFLELIKKMETLNQIDNSYQVGLSACYNYVGEGRQKLGRLDEALEYYLQAIRCCEGGKLVSGIGVFYSNAGYILYQQGNLEQAQAYIDKANRCFDQMGGFWGRVKARSYAAMLAVSRGDLADAEKNYQIAQAAARHSGNPTLLSLVEEVEKLLGTCGSSPSDP